MVGMPTVERSRDEGLPKRCPYLESFCRIPSRKKIRPREYLTEGELKLLMDHEFEDKALTAYFCRTGT